MNITIIGTGYVGLVTGACLADLGNNVFCLDVDQTKIDLLNNGGVPIYEPGLKEVIERNIEAGRLTFSTDVAASVAHGSIQFIAVGTPPDEDGSADLQYVLAAARNIGRHMTDFKVVVDKSTVPVGTADKVTAAINAELALRYGEPLEPTSHPSIRPDGLLRANGDTPSSEQPATPFVQSSAPPAPFVPSSAPPTPFMLSSAQRVSKHEAPAAYDTPTPFAPSSPQTPTPFVPSSAPPAPFMLSSAPPAPFVLSSAQRVSKHEAPAAYDTPTPFAPSSPQTPTPFAPSSAPPTPFMPSSAPPTPFMPSSAPPTPFVLSSAQRVSKHGSPGRLRYPHPIRAKQRTPHPVRAE